MNFNASDPEGIDLPRTRVEKDLLEYESFSLLQKIYYMLDVVQWRFEK